MGLARTALGIAVVVALAGCADQGGQILIVLNNTAPATDCVVTPSEGGSFIPTGRVDVGGVVDHNSNIGYIMTPTIKNIGDSEMGTLGTQRTVILHGAKIDITVSTHADGSELLTAADLDALNNINALKFTAPFSGAIQPDGGLVGIAFEAVPAAVIRAIGPKLLPQENALITATFTVFGDTVSGSGVEADAFAYPITVCDGCLFTDLQSCVGLPSGTYRAGGECNTFQDSPSECCTTSTGVFTCPATPE